VAKIVEVAPKDIYVAIEFSIRELDLLKTGLALAEIDYDGKDEEQAEASKYVKEFWKFLDDFLKEVKRDGS
jgi:hypothetical protein